MRSMLNLTRFHFTKFFLSRLFSSFSTNTCASDNHGRFRFATNDNTINEHNSIVEKNLKKYKAHLLTYSHVYDSFHQSHQTLAHFVALPLCHKSPFQLRFSGISFLDIFSCSVFLDKETMLKLFLLSFILVPICEGDPGVPGQEWSPELIQSVQYRLRRFWSYPSPFTKDFDLDQNAAKYQQFVYDPTNITVEPNCKSESTNCQNWWGEYTRGNDIGNIQFLSI